MTVDRDQLRMKWEEEFPGLGGTVTALRESLVLADYLVSESERAIADLQGLLEPLNEPMYWWPARLVRFYNSLKRQHARDVRLRNDLLRALRSGQSPKAGVPKAAVTAPPRDEKTNRFSVKMGPKEGFFMQDVHVSVVDGKTISKFDVGHEHWLKERPDDICESWVRHYYFADAEIPEEYAFVLEHEGVYYAPAKSFYITYAAEEFIRICQREKDADSEHALDGERLRYSRRDADR